MSMVFMKLAEQYHLYPQTREYDTARSFFFAGYEVAASTARKREEEKQAAGVQQTTQPTIPLRNPNGDCLNASINRGDSVRPRSCHKCGLSKNCPDGVIRNN